MRGLELKDKRILVIGYGRTGVAVVDFLMGRGCKIIVNDIKERSDFIEEKLRHYEKEGVEFIFGSHDKELCYSVDLIIISPGVDPNWIPMDKLKERGIEIISEIELAYNFCEGKIIGITGTNGKTTVTTLLGQLFNNAGMRASVCGNIGNPFIKAVRSEQKYDYYIVEISSFQLEAIRRFKANGAILLNISEDHFDRYKGIEDYLSAKWNIFRNQDSKDWAVINKDQEEYWDRMERIRACVWEFSVSREVERGCYLKDGVVYYTDGKNREDIIPLSEIQLKGMHNVENIMACIIASVQVGITKEKIVDTIKRFKSLPHRMELVAVKDGVSFINDSKATNTDAVVKALEGNNKNVILILGGKDKHLNYEVLLEPIKKYVKAVILIGEAREAIGKIVGKSGVYKDEAMTMEEAVEKAYLRSEKGDVIMLSPACSSFDMFKNYEERGEVFKQAVMKLIEREGRGGK
jgi:UDP-N-acetylmuramoylalanine--D-glutamate ligase